MMFSLKRLLSCVLTLSCLALAPIAAQAAADAPDALIRSTSKQILDLLRKDDGKNIRQLRSDIEAIAIPRFDFKRMTALAVGRGWKEATQPQQDALQVQFQNLLVRTYTSTMHRFRNAQVTINGSPVISSDGNEATVRSEISTGDGSKPVQVDYTLYKGSTGWKIYNVSVEGASLVTVYRSNFMDILRKNGVDGLIQSLKEKNDTLANKNV